MFRSFQPFEMERMMARWENRVEYNLSESGVRPLTIQELLADAEARESILATELGYPQVNGSPELRERIAATYPHCSPENVLVTVGCAEANFLAMQTLLEPGAEIACMLPNYLQIWGLANNLGAHIRPFCLEESRDWAPNLTTLTSDNTRIIAVCNPNNPTGYILTESEMDTIVAAAERTGAWILADEVYAGTERVTETVTPSFWGRYDKVLAMGSLSKAYGLPGLRIGWVVGPRAMIDELWARHDYIAISAGGLDNKLAAIALESAQRQRLIARTRGLIRQGYAVLDHWVQNNSDLVTLVAPMAAAVAFIRYNIDIDSVPLVQKLIAEKNVLIVPGTHLGLDRHLRLSFGMGPEYLKAGLQRLQGLLQELRTSVKK